MEGGGCNNAKCPFAHGEEELRSTDMFYKKTLCIWNEKGKCRNGDQCRFAHGLVELRANQGLLPAALEPWRMGDVDGAAEAAVAAAVTAPPGAVAGRTKPPAQ